MSDYDLLPVCLKILHDTFILGKEYYYFQPIDLNKITIRKLKKNTNFNHDNYLEDITYLGKINDYQIYSHPSTPYSYNILFSLYSKDNQHLNDIERFEINSVKMLYLLSEVCHYHQVRHISLPVMNFDIQFNELEDSIKYKLLGDSEDIVLVQIIEGFNDTYTFLEYYNKYGLTEEEWKILIYQVLYTIIKISKKYPQFRHNSLDIKSLLIQRDETIQDNFKIYNFNTEVFKFDNMKFITKIFDFRESTMNEDTVAKDNIFHDIHYFLHSIIFFFDEIERELPYSLRLFIESIVPENLRYRQLNFRGVRDTLLDNVEFNFSDMFENIFFSNYKI